MFTSAFRGGAAFSNLMIYLLPPATKWWPRDAVVVAEENRTLTSALPFLLGW